MPNNYSRYSLSFQHGKVRSIVVSDPSLTPEGFRFVNALGAYPSASDVIYGVTIHDRNRPGSFQAVTTVPAITATAKVAGERFTLTVAQAANVGGRAGIYQVRTAFTPAATTLTAAEGLNVFYVGANLKPESAVKEYGFSSETPLMPASDIYNYQKVFAVAIDGRVIVEAAGAIAVGAKVDSNTSGQAIIAAGTRVAGVALTAAVAAGDFIELELGVK